MMNIVSRIKLDGYKKQFSGARKPLERWYDVVSHANWNTPDDLKGEFSSASILSGNRVKFNIGGGKFRLLVGINYPGKQIFIKWFGTHAEYDKKEF